MWHWPMGLLYSYKAQSYFGLSESMIWIKHTHLQSLLIFVDQTWKQPGECGSMEETRAKFVFAYWTLALKETMNSTKQFKKNKNYNKIFEKPFIQIVWGFDSLEFWYVWWGSKIQRTACKLAELRKQPTRLGVIFWSKFKYWCTEERLTSDGAERGPSPEAWAEAWYGSLSPPIYVPCKPPARVYRIIR
jgi:hypothetical protein